MNSKYLLLKGWWGIAGLLVLIRPAIVPAQVRVDVPYADQNGKMMVEATVNQVKGRFLIDTGAPCALTYSFAQKLGLEVQGNALQVEDSNGNLTETYLGSIDSLKLGAVTFAGLQAVRLSQGEWIESFGVDGIIGYNLMKQGLVKFDGTKHLFTFTTYDRDLGIDYAYAIPLVKDPYVTLLPIRLGEGLSDTVMFDSGARAFYEMSAGTYARMAKHKKAVKTLCSGEGILSLGAAGLEQKSQKYRLKIPEWTIGTVHFTNVTSITTQAAYSRLGSDLLRYGTVIIDFPGQVFYYIPREPGKKTDLYEADWDVTITVMDKTLRAGLVWSDSKSGLSGGERIVEVNGRRYDDDIDLFQASTQPLIQLTGEEVPIKYIDPEGVERETVIRKR